MILYSVYIDIDIDGTMHHYSWNHYCRLLSVAVDAKCIVRRANNTVSKMHQLLNWVKIKGRCLLCAKKLMSSELGLWHVTKNVKITEGISCVLVFSRVIFACIRYACLCKWQLDAHTLAEETIAKLQQKLENAEAVINMKSESERLTSRLCYNVAWLLVCFLFW